MRPQSQFQECYCCHRFKNVTAVTATRMLHRPLLQECYGSHRFKNFTAVIASRMLLLQAGCRSHRFNKNVTVTASRTLPQSSLQECYRCDRVREGATITAPRMLLLLPFTLVYSFGSSKCPLTHSVWGLLPGYFLHVTKLQATGEI